MYMNNLFFLKIVIVKAAIIKALNLSRKITLENHKFLNGLQGKKKKESTILGMMTKFHTEQSFKWNSLENLILKEHPVTWVAAQIKQIILY